MESEQQQPSIIDEVHADAEKVSLRCVHRESLRPPSAPMRRYAVMGLGCDDDEEEEEEALIKKPPSHFLLALPAREYEASTVRLSRCTSAACAAFEASCATLEERGCWYYYHAHLKSWVKLVEYPIDLDRELPLSVDEIADCVHHPASKTRADVDGRIRCTRLVARERIEPNSWLGVYSKGGECMTAEEYDLLPAGVRAYAGQVAYGFKPPNAGGREVVFVGVAAALVNVNDHRNASETKCVSRGCYGTCLGRCDAYDRPPNCILYPAVYLPAVGEVGDPIYCVMGESGDAPIQANEEALLDYTAGYWNAVRSMRGLRAAVDFEALKKAEAIRRVRSELRLEDSDAEVSAFEVTFCGVDYVGAMTKVVSDRSFRHLDTCTLEMTVGDLLLGLLNRLEHLRVLDVFRVILGSTGEPYSRARPLSIAVYDLVNGRAFLRLPECSYRVTALFVVCRLESEVVATLARDRIGVTDDAVRVIWAAKGRSSKAVRRAIHDYVASPPGSDRYSPIVAECLDYEGLDGEPLGVGVVFKVRPISR